MSRPAILGGDPAFDPPLPFARPTIEDRAKVLAMMSESLESGIVTNGPRVAQLEERAAEAFEVRHCVAVSSCTIGLMLAIQALSPEGVVTVPSFTFSATAHAVAWNGHDPYFVDCNAITWCLGPDDVQAGADLVVAVHISGVPCDVEALERRCKEIGARLVFDAAHGAGSRVATATGDRPLGAYGDAEIFSLTPTKVLSGAEGGLVTTDDPDLAERIRTARDYGNPGDYDTLFVGLNGRLSELNAALALSSFDYLEERVERRNHLAERYRASLGVVPGVEFQVVRQGDRSSYKDFTILADEAGLGVTRDQLVRALHAEGIPTRPYYSPPVHRQRAYSHLPERSLPVTGHLAARVVSLPIWSHLQEEVVERIADAISRIHEHADEVIQAHEADGAP